MTALKQLILKLAEARQLESDLKREYAGILDSVKMATSFANKLEKEVREAARQEFERFGDLKPHDAVEIKMRRKVSYDTPLNLEAAIEEAPEVVTVDLDRLAAHASVLIPLIAQHAPDVLVINEKALAAKVDVGEANWAEARVYSEPTVYLKSKLGEYLITQGE